MKSVAKKRKKVFIADDDRAIVEAVSFTLNEMGFDVETSYGEGVISLIKEKKPDLLLLDIWMSGTDGGEICSRLKSSPETADMPVIMISANPDAGKVSEHCGADDYILKPFGLKELLCKIKLNIE